MKLKEKRHLEKINKTREKYPSIVKKIVEISDVILQILDARFIKETRNLELEEIIKSKNKKLINVINKTDLIKTKKFFELSLEDIKPYVFVSCKSRKGIKKLRDLIKIESKKIKNPVNKTIKQGKIVQLDAKPKLLVGVIGYPNIGKSTLINILIGKRKAGTGAEAGFTKGIQKFKLNSEINILDTPGVIPESVYNHIKPDKISKHAKLGGRSYSQIKEPEIVFEELFKEYKEILEDFYGINSEGDSEIFIEKLGKKKSFFKKGGEVNTDKAARLILKDWQEGKIKL